MKYEYNNLESIKLSLKKIKDLNKKCYAIIVEPFSTSTLRKTSNEFLYNLKKFM